MSRICRIFLALVIFAIALFGCARDSQDNAASQNPCQQVLSLEEIKSICSPDFEIAESVNQSYYFIPNETNVELGEWGYIIRPTETSSRVLINGTEWLCEKTVSNNKKSYEPESNSILLQIESFGSADFANSAWAWYNSENSNVNDSGLVIFFKEGEDFGDKSVIISYAGGEKYDAVYNMSYNTLKSTSVHFLKNNRIILISEDSHKDNNLICNLEQIQKLASLVDKRIS